ncbi:MAG: DNA methylase [Planctomycetes bacterium]|nr:DNA methylase [Planctomycetota bacterium]
MRPLPPPRLQTTTLWAHPSGQYGDRPMGVPGYPGATPAWVVWNLLERYTRPGDLVIDPFAGGGTTNDVAESLGRRALGFDLQPQKPVGIALADARRLPLVDAAADFAFLDPPYSTHIRYSGRPECIGELDAFESGYFEAMDATFAEVARVLKARRYLAVYCSDTYRHKQGFVGIGARFFALLERRFSAVDHCVVARGNRKLGAESHHRAAGEGNFFLRGFQHLLIFKHTRPSAPQPVSRGSARRRA